MNLILIALIVISCSSAPQNNVVQNKQDSIPTSKIKITDGDSIYNKFDSLGRKTGLWKMVDGSLTMYAFYKEDKKDGTELIYHSNGRIYYYNIYKSGQQVASAVYNEDGTICYDESSMKDLANKLFSSYLILYYTNGYKKSEGYVVYDSSPSLDYKEKGLWKYYDKNGKLIKTKKFPNNPKYFMEETQ